MNFSWDKATPYLLAGILVFLAVTAALFAADLAAYRDHADAVREWSETVKIYCGRGFK